MKINIKDLEVNDRVIVDDKKLTVTEIYNGMIGGREGSRLIYFDDGSWTNEFCTSAVIIERAIK